MQLEWGTLLEQARANHAQACANQAFAEAPLLAMRRSHGEWHGQDGELEAWFSDAHGVAVVAGAMFQSQGGTMEEPGPHRAHDKAGNQGICHGVTAATRGEGASWVGTPPRAGVGKALHECDVSLLGTVICERPWSSIDAVVWALPRPPEGDNVSSGDGEAAE